MVLQIQRDKLPARKNENLEEKKKTEGSWVTKQQKFAYINCSGHMI